MDGPGRSLVRGPGEGRVVSVGASTVRVLSVGADTGGASSVEEIGVPAGFGGPMAHIHRRTSHSWYVLEGELLLTVDGDPHAVPVGGFVHVPAGVPHTFANPSGTPARMLELTTPGGFDEYLDDLAAAFPPGADLDPGRMAEVMARHDTFPAG